MVGALGITMTLATMLTGAWIGWNRGRDDMRSARDFLRGLGICLFVATAVNFIILLAVVGVTRASLGAAFSLSETLWMLVITAALWLPATGIAFTWQAIRERSA